MTEPQKRNHLWFTPEIITLVGAVLLQTLGLGWWSSKQDSRIGNLEVNAIELKARVGTHDQDRERLIRLEEGNTFILKTLQRIEQKLESTK